MSLTAGVETSPRQLVPDAEFSNKISVHEDNRTVLGEERTLPSLRVNGDGSTNADAKEVTKEKMHDRSDPELQEGWLLQNSPLQPEVIAVLDARDRGSTSGQDLDEGLSENIPRKVPPATSSADLDVPILDLALPGSPLPSPFSPSESLDPLNPASSDGSNSVQALKPISSLRQVVDEVDSVNSSAEALREKGIASSFGNDGLLASGDVDSKGAEGPARVPSLPRLNEPQESGLSSPNTPSPPESPLESIRSLTSPFPEESDAAQVTEPALLSVPSGDMVLLTTPNFDAEKRRHSSVTAAGDLFLPVPFPEQRRYSLVDSGAIPAAGSGRRTLSDIGRTTPPQMRPRARQDGSDTDSVPSSRSPSRPTTARYSTFAEMGIQSFAMAKGEKTVDREKKDKEANVKGGKKRKGNESSLSGKVQIKESDEPKGEFDTGATTAVAAQTLETTEAQDDESKRKGGRRKPKTKGVDCVVM